MKKVKHAYFVQNFRSPCLVPKTIMVSSILKGPATTEEIWCSIYASTRGVGDIAKKTIDSQYIVIFSNHRQIIDIKNIIGNYRKIIDKCIQFHPINSIESPVPKTRKRVFDIPDKY